jgi:acetyl esterase/lipase
MLCAASLAAHAGAEIAQQDLGNLTVHGGILVPSYELPLSSYMSKEAKRAYVEWRKFPALDFSQGISHVREQVDRISERLLEQALVAFPAKIEEERIAGVPVAVVVPNQPLSNQNLHRVLISLHGGSFIVGGGRGRLADSVGIAWAAGIKVISVNYRLSPEYSFPAASEDVTAVYKVLLKQYRPENIGIYGCSAGGLLTGMAVAWIQKQKLPRPGAIGIFSAADAVLGGDSRFMAATVGPFSKSAAPPGPDPNPPPSSLGYLGGVNPDDPLVSPTLHPEVIAQFPPTLLITGTRDASASSVIYAHSELIKAGVPAELHVSEGMWDGYFEDASMPESRQMYAVVARFFNSHLGDSH